MYESEVNTVLESVDSLPPEIRQRFGELHGQIEARSLLPWGEHCTECNWPVCFTSCELYSRRQDGGCRLFMDGMVRIDLPEGANPYLLKIRFKRWGKLWTQAALHLFSVPESLKRERSNIARGGVARALPLPAPLKERVLRKISYWRRQDAESLRPESLMPDCFVLECYNPNDREICLTFTIREPQNGKPVQPFQRMLK